MSQKYRFKPTVSICTSGVVLSEDQVRDIAAALCPQDVQACGGDFTLGLDFFLSRQERHSQLIPFTDEVTKEDKILFSLAYFPENRDAPVTQLQWDQQAINKWWETYGSCESTKDVKTKSVRYPKWAAKREWMKDELIKATPHMPNYERLLYRICDKPPPQSRP
ncbi:hypothetical protein GYMLUDRAFT_265443 [Collybiopsis luxurians FD-317 M1]|uniref:Uncharacterized protein n=1 Tax=Collybiopsis luxurians FD-317 M1 TaxID=944289 RepID=A0A0D0BS29_9AGAR|nr:hypothetical protein GYMLUDRAFT_265443 [Collybiopsis luxurians FD-317 M1]